MDKWITLAPIDDYFDQEKKLSIPFKFDDNLSIDYIPNWPKGESFTKYMSYHQRETIIGKSELAFLVAYEAESFGDPDTTWKGEEIAIRSKQDIASEKIIFANIALWIAKPTSVSFQMILHSQQLDGEWLLRQMYTSQDMKIDEKFRSNKLRDEDLKHAKSLYDVIYNLPRKGSLWVAIRLVHQALIAPSWDLSFLMYWISLEALFGTESELTYRLSLRIANFLSDTKREAEKTFSKIKHIYNQRSKIVHGRGMPGKGTEERRAMMLETQYFIRYSLSKILSCEKEQEIFNSDKRDRYLDSLCLKNK